MNIAIYGRVSTAEQSVDLQVSELTAYAGRMGWTVAGCYLDEGVSGTKDSRPSLDRLMTDARLKRFDAVLVWKLDRFGRSLAQLVRNVQLLDGYGVKFISTTEGISTDKKSPVGQLMLHLFASFAEFERALIVERVNAGVAEAKRQGKHCGRPQRIFRRDDALILRRQGQSFRQIAKTLNVPVMTVTDAVRKALLIESAVGQANEALSVA